MIEDEANWHFLFYFSVFKRFSQLDPEAVQSNKNARLAKNLLMDLPELRVFGNSNLGNFSLLFVRKFLNTQCTLVFFQVNPFRDRICDVFSSSNDGQMTFEDFLDMMSVFSDNAPKNVKVEYAFRIYGRSTFFSV